MGFPCLLSRHPPAKQESPYKLGRKTSEGKAVAQTPQQASNHGGPNPGVPVPSDDLSFHFVLGVMRA